ncbi:MAG: hypothetical protein LBD82_07765 [Deltaproteobacteria bacterium]|jgi:hypothetical protein|nr:hypothetical protein [Deltaproteobacteria bacterium]
MACEMNTEFEHFSLPGYSGKNLEFRGRLFAESTSGDQEDGSPSRVRLFVTADKRLIYSLVSGVGKNKSRRLYILTKEDEVWRLDDGRQQISMPEEMFFILIKGICEITDEYCETFRSMLHDSLCPAVA